MRPPQDLLSAVESADRALEALNLPVPAAILDLDMTIQWINRTACERYALSAARVVGRSWYDWFPESRARLSLHQELARGERSQLDLLPVPLCRDSAGTHYFKFRLRPLKTPDGAVVAIVGFGEDVTSLVHAEQAAATSEERFRHVATRAQDLIVILAFDATIEFINVAGARVLGRGAGIGASIFEFVHPEDLPRAKELFRKLVGDPSAGLVTNAVVRNPHDDGTCRWLEFTGTSMLDLPAVRGILLIGRDITERKQLEQRLTGLVNQEQHRIGQDLHEGLGQDLTGIALTIRSISTSLRRANPPNAAALEDVLQHVNQAIETVCTLAHGLAPVNRDRGGILFALQTLASQATTTFGVTVRFVSQVSSPLTIGEHVANQLFRIAQEALTNSVRHGKATTVVVRLAVTEHSIRLTISDDGCGFPANVRNSTGMGLRIMDYRTRAIDGTVTFGTCRGGGARVTVRCRA